MRSARYNLSSKRRKSIKKTSDSSWKMLKIIIVLLNGRVDSKKTRNHSNPRENPLKLRLFCRLPHFCTSFLTLHSVFFFQSFFHLRSSLSISHILNGFPLKHEHDKSMNWTEINRVFQQEKRILQPHYSTYE